MPALGPDAVQSDTSTFVVTIGAGQVVVVYELAAVGPLAVDATRESDVRIR